MHICLLIDVLTNYPAAISTDDIKSLKNKCFNLQSHFFVPGAQIHQYVDMLKTKAALLLLTIFLAFKNSWKHLALVMGSDINSNPT